jgi:hypothetical protein
MVKTLPGRTFTPFERMSRFGPFRKGGGVGYHVVDGVQETPHKLVVIVGDFKRSLLRGNR